MKFIFFTLFIPSVLFSQSNTLQAILIVGDHQDKTSIAIEEMEVLHSFFKDKKVIVKTFYHPNTRWDEIINVSKNSNFLVYSGHGISWPDGKYGGLDLNESISSKDIQSSLKLKSNSLIIFKSVCGGAGSSASDYGDIGIDKAMERVSDYSRPFFNIGASAYYANNFGEGCLFFLDDFFDGKTIKECFDNSAGWYSKIEIEKQYKFDVRKMIGIASSDGEGIIIKTSYENGVKTVSEVPASKNYNIAYVSNPKFSISNLKSK